MRPTTRQLIESFRARRTWLKHPPLIKEAAEFHRIQRRHVSHEHVRINERSLLDFRLHLVSLDKEKDYVTDCE